MSVVVRVSFIYRWFLAKFDNISCLLAVSFLSDLFISNKNIKATRSWSNTGLFVNFMQAVLYR